MRSANRFLKLTVSLALAATLVAGETQASAICDSQYQNLISNPPKSTDSLKTFSEYSTQKEAALTCMAHEKVSSFINQGTKIQYRELVTDPLDVQILQQNLSVESLKQTIQYFARSNSPVVKTWIVLIKSKSQKQGLGFNLTESGQAIRDLPAGYVRAQGHVIMNYTIMTRDDWLFLFLHEFSHYTDNFLDQAVAQALAFQQSHPGFAQLMASWFNAMPFSQFSQDQQTQTDEFLKLAIARGAIAEYRAWADTFDLYRALRSDQLIQPVAFAETALKLGPNNEDSLTLTLKLFEGKDGAPTTGLYANPAIRARDQLLLNQMKATLHNQ